jgi:hypothetical protein|tara:strand:+ start:1462 stop:2145 length:684 start_codon:yes stop_codon:yes gene_type:complete
MLKYIIAFLSLCLVSPSCFAQEEQVTLQFVSFPKLSNSKPVELFIGEGKTIEVELPTNRLSPTYKVDRLAQWELGKSSIGADEKPVFETYGKATSIASNKQLILIIRKGANDSDGFKMIVMDKQQSKFGGGDYFFMNASTVSIGLKIGDKQLLLKPRSHELIKPAPSKVKGKRKYLYTYFYYRKKDKMVPFYNSTWRYSKKARCMVFFYHDTHTKQLRTHSIRNYIE